MDALSVLRTPVPQRTITGLVVSGKLPEGVLAVTLKLDDNEDSCCAVEV